MAVILNPNVSDFDNVFASTEAETETCPYNVRTEKCIATITAVSLFNITSLLKVFLF